MRKLILSIGKGNRVVASPSDEQLPLEQKTSAVTPELEEEAILLGMYRGLPQQFQQTILDIVVDMHVMTRKVQENK